MHYTNVLTVWCMFFRDSIEKINIHFQTPQFYLHYLQFTISFNFKSESTIEIIKHKARHNLINVKLRSDRLDGAVVGSFLGTPWSIKVMHSRQRETTHEICCLAAELYYQLSYHWIRTIISLSYIGPMLSQKQVR